ncbi:hypothetical protein RN001_006803 [Aquatica leii]|uniref:Nose resistant-to-fluoxetine protein N-terminal domain-containing protein n=1 Tax=Aquatica leii TaxID=1421715 RepID=A0AAN7SK23_9COLE|nr:hypothetical protein RN001_006803 [Aquatica leii]
MTLYLIFLILISGVLTQIGTNAERSNEMDYTEGATIEKKILIGAVNDSAFSDFNETFPNELPSLSKVLNFYNTELLAANWYRFHKSITETCQEKMQEYIIGLSIGAHWALKMDDASGRYTTGWFWGNHYWTGSQSLCENALPNDNMDVDNSTFTESDYTHLYKYKSVLLAHLKTSPFPLGYFMLRVNINSSFTTEQKTVHIGLCLPKICTDDDARKIMEETSKTAPMVTVKVETVRSHHQRFNVWTDSTFQILCVVSSIVAVLLISGTTFDMYVQRLKEKRKTMVMNCTNYANTDSNLRETVAKLDVGIADSKMYNGNSGFYVVTKTQTKDNDSNNNNNNNNNDQAPSTSGTETPIQDHNEYPELKLDKQFALCLLRRLLLSFSIRVNAKNIFNKNVGSDTLSVIHGLKTISMSWVILGHTCLVAFKYADNTEYRKLVQQEFMFQTVLNATFSVDTFFFTSGLLVSFLYFRTNSKGKLDHPITSKCNGFASGLCHFIGLIIYRFARLTAPYLFLIGVLEVTMKWFNYNSVFEPPALDHINCPKYWWRNLLYINTLFPMEEMCMLWSWYLADDTQFYIVGAVLLILAVRHFKSAASLLVMFVVSSWMTTAYIAYSNRHMPGSDDPLALFDKIYDKPWTRLSPYLIGMCVGWFLFKTKCQLKMSKITVTAGWLVSSTCLLSLVYGLYEANLTPIMGAAYSALCHSIWALGLSWIVVACTTGYGGFVNKLLSASVLYPFSRVTYCAYLLHTIVIRGMVMSMDQPLHLGKAVVPILFLGQIVASYTLAFIVSISFEGPSVSMLRILTKLTRTKETN